MEKNMNKEAEIVEETAAVNEVTESSKEIVPVNKGAKEAQITDSDITHSSLPPKKTRGTAAKLVVLALCCSLVGGAVGAGGVIAVDRLLIRRNTKIARTQDAGPATRGLRIRKGNEQINVEVPPDNSKSQTRKKPTKAQDAGGQTPYTNDRPTRNNDSSQAQKPADQ